RNDKVDAGEVGSGHTVTALYELELVPSAKGPLATMRVRAKAPEGTTAAESSFAIDTTDVKKSAKEASGDFQFATAVMGFAEVLRKSESFDIGDLKLVRELAETTAHSTEREEFLTL